MRCVSAGGGAHGLGVGESGTVVPLRTGAASAPKLPLPHRRRQCFALSQSQDREIRGGGVLITAPPPHPRSDD